MIATATDHATQLELDYATDSERIERNLWQRAIDHNLHAIRDYIDPSQLIIWQPGKRGRRGATALDVQLVSTTACSCQRHRLHGSCSHTAFARRLVEAGHTISTDTPIAAREIQ